MSVTVRTIVQTMSGPIDEDITIDDGTSFFTDTEGELTVEREAGADPIAIFASGRWTFARVETEKNTP